MNEESLGVAETHRPPVHNVRGATEMGWRDQEGFLEEVALDRP